MSERAAVAFSVCKSILIQLSGFRGYPKPGPGEDYFVKALQGAAVSVDHVRAIVASFTGGFPTIQEIRDTALNLRPQFEPTEDQRAAWEAKYGKPEPVVLDGAKLTGNERQAVLWREIFKRIPDRLKIRKMSWRQLAAVVREIGGYEDIAEAWERSERHAG